MIEIRFPKNDQLRDKMCEALAGWPPFIGTDVVVSDGAPGDEDHTTLIVGPDSSYNMLIDIKLAEVVREEFND